MLNFYRSLVGVIVALMVLPAQATPDPNQVMRPEPGWGKWQPRSAISKAGFSAGFSNLELGGFLDFEQACSEALGTAKDEMPYWFRLSESVSRIGTGTVEFGCWKDGAMTFTLTNTAVLTEVGDITCLRLRVPTGEDLRIRAEPGLRARIVGFARNGATVKPTSFPALIVQADNRNWLEIAAPQRGWISDDRPGSPGNLTRCR